MTQATEEVGTEVVMSDSDWIADLRKSNRPYKSLNEAEKKRWDDFHNNENRLKARFNAGKMRRFNLLSGRALPSADPAHEDAVATLGHLICQAMAGRIKNSRRGRGAAAQPITQTMVQAALDRLETEGNTLLPDAVEYYKQLVASAKDAIGTAVDTRIPIVLGIREGRKDTLINALSSCRADAQASAMEDKAA